MQTALFIFEIKTYCTSPQSSLLFYELEALLLETENFTFTPSLTPLVNSASVSY